MGSYNLNYRNRNWSGVIILFDLVTIVHCANSSSHRPLVPIVLLARKTLHAGPVAIAPASPFVLSNFSTLLRQVCSLSFVLARVQPRVALAIFQSLSAVVAFQSRIESKVYWFCCENDPWLLNLDDLSMVRNDRANEETSTKGITTLVQASHARNRS